MARAAITGLVLIFIALAVASFAHIYKRWVKISSDEFEYVGLWENSNVTGTTVHTSWSEYEPILTKALAIAGTAFLVFALLFLNIHLCKKDRCTGIAAAIFSLLGGLFLCGCAGYFLGWFWDDRKHMRIGFFAMCAAGGIGLLAAIFLIANACKLDNKIRLSDSSSYGHAPQKTASRRNNVDLTPRNIKLDLSTTRGGARNKRR